MDFDRDSLHDALGVRTLLLIMFAYEKGEREKKDFDRDSLHDVCALCPYTTSPHVCL